MSTYGKQANKRTKGSKAPWRGIYIRQKRYGRSELLPSAFSPCCPLGELKKRQVITPVTACIKPRAMRAQAFQRQ